MYWCKFYIKFTFVCIWNVFDEIKFWSTLKKQLVPHCLKPLSLILRKRPVNCFYRRPAEDHWKLRSRNVINGSSSYYYSYSSTSASSTSHPPPQICNEYIYNSSCCATFFAVLQERACIDFLCSMMHFSRKILKIGKSYSVGLRYFFKSYII
jgi:hypothetical protein